MDAPSHIIEGGRTIDLLTMDELVVDCVVVDVSDRADESFMVMPSVIEEFEKAHGEIPKSSLIIFYTGWSKFWNEPAKYHNEHKFPSVHPDTAEILVKRGVVGVGIDTLSCDTGADGFPVHRIILGADKYLVENVTNADKLPLTGAKVFVMPTKIKGATEAPIRLVALI
jgi:kynurenine formamidase